MVAIDKTTNGNSAEAGKELANSTKAKLGSSPTWAIAYCAGKHDKEAFLSGIRNVLGDIPVFGGAAVGIITNDFFGYDGFEASLTLFGEEMRYKAIATGDLTNGQLEGGRELGEKLSGKVTKDDTILMFFDTLVSTPPPQMYSGSEIINGFNLGIGGDDYTILGSGLVADMNLMDSYVFSGGKAEKHIVSAVVIPSEIKMNYRILHGCEPISSYMTITKIEGPVVFEIDNRPALEVVLDALGLDPTEDNIKSLTTVVTLGENRGEPFGDYDESKYVNRMIIMGNPENGSIILFEADFEVGTRIQIMSRSNDLMIESARKNAESLLSEVNVENTFCFYIDCAGRCRPFSGADQDDAELIQEVFSDMPLSGFYSGVEIAPLLGKSRPLDWTGVLMTFSK